MTSPELRARLQAHRALTWLYRHARIELENQLLLAPHYPNPHWDRARATMVYLDTVGRQIIGDLHRFVARGPMALQKFMAAAAESLLDARYANGERPILIRLEPVWEELGRRLDWVKSVLSAIGESAEWAEKHLKDSKVSGEAKG